MKIALGICMVLLSCISGWSALAEPLNPEQVKLINDTAASICNTIKEARGQKTDVQVEGDVKAQVGGLIGKIADLGGGAKGKLSKEDFEGLSRDATATALEGDRGCRERVFNRMFDKLSEQTSPVPPRPVKKVSFKLCFGAGGGVNCLDGADIKYDCDKYHGWKAADWDDLATELCGSKDKMRKYQSQWNGGGGCGWTAYALSCSE
ncbi:hypothetical protein BSZ19_02030 [Bradyrhizobium japonicum]|uniref:Uncharacterized protein n=1 Tax=Bradyrhizobium japonicum TaxID=375 RepID=A0A1Y2JYM9_BRAJP|nr:hypothetical protein [Bradyrhizobium japonicum]OSJ36891.1 hypothetical protein BSZ19_02030 [Bradyrhizobium japonicum]